MLKKFPKRSPHLHKRLVKKVMASSEGRAAYEAFKLQLVENSIERHYFKSSK